MKGLLIRKPWLDRIFYHGKHWEMRSTHTKQRGLVYLIEAGSGLIVGQCKIIGSREISQAIAKENPRAHQVDDYHLLDKWRFAWELSDVERYDTPIRYQHPQGAVIWVNLPDNLHGGQQEHV